jgi:hypothetical protein
MPGHVLRRAGKDARETVAEEVLDHPYIEVQAERFRNVCSGEPDPGPGEVDLEIDFEQV